MGTMKRQLEEHEEYYNLAKQVLIDINAISTCEHHPDFDNFYFQSSNYEEKQIYACATEKFQELFPEFKNYKLLHEKINQILKEASLEDECPVCQKINQD